MLKSRGINIQWYRLRESIKRIDPIRTSARWHQVVQRRKYNVAGPNALWHIDGNHSLVRWRFVIHGSVDGYSRHTLAVQPTIKVQQFIIYLSAQFKIMDTRLVSGQTKELRMEKYVSI